MSARKPPATDGRRIIENEMDQVGVEIVDGVTARVDRALSLVDSDGWSTGESGRDGESREGGYV